MANDQVFEFDSLQDPSTIKGFLESLTEGFAGGKIVLSSENEEIVLYPNALLRFTIKAKRRINEKSQLTIKFSWKEPKMEMRGADKQIRISS